MSALTMRFLGVGNAAAVELGASACVLQQAGRPLLLIDCGPDTPRRYQAAFDDSPRAVFITHVHLDHVGGLESLFYRAILSPALRGRIKLYTPYALVPALQERLAMAPMTLAEGGANFFDAFQLVPVAAQFWHENLLFRTFAVRHHGYQSAFGISLPGAFPHTGDTRPIPEVVTTFASHAETIFHDCGVLSNPAHTGLDDMASNYSLEQRSRMVLYHYESEGAARHLEAAGYRVARPGQRFPLAGDAREAHSGPTVVAVSAP